MCARKFGSTSVIQFRGSVRTIARGLTPTTSPGPYSCTDCSTGPVTGLTPDTGVPVSCRVTATLALEAVPGSSLIRPAMPTRSQERKEYELTLAPPQCRG